MPRLPGVYHLDAVRAVEKAGFRVARQGRHVVMTDGVRILTIPRHDPANAFTMAGIAHDAGLTVEAFRALLSALPDSASRRQRLPLPLHPVPGAEVLGHDAAVKEVGDAVGRGEVVGMYRFERPYRASVTLEELPPPEREPSREPDVPF